DYTAEITGLTQSHATNCTGDYELPASGLSQDYTIERKRLDLIWATDTLSGANISAWDGFSVEYCNVERSVTATVATGATAANDGKAYEAVTVSLSNNTGRNVGTYTALVAGLDNANYYVASGSSQTFYITKINITNITFASQEIVFNAAEHEFSVSTLQTQYGDHVTVVYSGSVTTQYGKSALRDNHFARNAGVYSITATIAESTNYNEWTRTSTFTISRAPLTSMALSAVVADYDTLDHIVSLPANYAYGTDTDVLSPTYTIAGTLANGTAVASHAGNSATEAGVYTVTVTIDPTREVSGDYPNANYQAKTTSAMLTINRVDIVFTSAVWTGDSDFVYDAQYHSVYVSLTSAGGADRTQYGHEVTVVYTGGEINGNEVKSARSYTVTANVSCGNNYNGRSYQASLTISPKPVTLTWQADDFTYSGADQTIDIQPTLTYGASVDNDNKVYDGDSPIVSIDIVGTDSNNSGDTAFFNAGHYTVTARLDTTDYVLTSTTHTYEIKAVEINWLYMNGYEVEYNAILHYIGIARESDAIVQTTVSSVDLLGSDTATVTYYYNTTGVDAAYTATFTGAKYAGFYYVRADIVDNSGKSNYQAKSLKATIHILQTNLSGFTLTSQSFIYDGIAHTMAIEALSSQYVRGVYYSQFNEPLSLTYTVDDVTVASVSETHVKDVAGVASPYVVKAIFAFTGAESAQLAASYITSSMTKTATLTINKRTLTGITLTGQTIPYDKTTHALSPVLTSAAAGSYPQYSVSGTALTVQLATTHAGDLFVITTAEENSLTALNVGKYTFVTSIVPGTGTTATDYVPFTSLRAELDIEKATMANDAGAAYVGDSNLFFNDCSTVYLAADIGILVATTSSASVITTTPVTSWTIHPFTNSAATDTATVTYLYNGVLANTVHDYGVYTVVATIANDNYETIELSATLTITKATIDYFFVGTERYYDGNVHRAGLNASNAWLDSSPTTISLVGSDTATVAYTYSSANNGSGSFSGATNADTYTITATVTVNGGNGENYEPWGPNTVTLKIKPVEVTVDWVKNSSYTYNAADQGNTISASFEGVSGTVDLRVDFLGTSGVATDSTVFLSSGTYTVTAVYESDYPGNYSISDDVITLTIAKFAATVTWTKAASYTYNRASQAGTVTATMPLASGGTYTMPRAFLGTSSAVSGHTDFFHAGTYTVTATYPFADIANYTITGSEIELVMAQFASSVVWSMPASFTYNGASQANSVSATMRLADGNDYVIPLTFEGTAGPGSGSTDFRAAGTYTVTANYAYDDLDDYDMVRDFTKELTIAKFAATVTWTNNASYHYTGSSQAGTVSATMPLASGGTYDMVVTFEGTSGPANGLTSFLYAGDYTVTATYAEADIANYTITNTTKSLEIELFASTVQWVYLDSYVYRASSYESTVGASMTLANNTHYDIPITFEGTSGPAYGLSTFLNAGDYTVTATYEYDDIANYDITGVFEIELT
ncbi:MAG: hypothetical protein J5755_00915, partial [Clostridia bacterium]|nr:hypothetical protein [Clostridia bacterium]